MILHFAKITSVTFYHLGVEESELDIEYKHCKWYSTNYDLNTENENKNDFILESIIINNEKKNSLYNRKRLYNSCIGMIEYRWSAFDVFAQLSINHREKSLN